jgi:hypothetical protein
MIPLSDHDVDEFAYKLECILMDNWSTVNLLIKAQLHCKLSKKEQIRVLRRLVERMEELEYE